MPDQPLDLDAIEQRTNAATPGPWQWHISRRTLDYRLQTAGWDVVMGFARWGRNSAQPEFNIDGLLHHGADLDQPHPDAEFIAAARTDVPALVAAVRRLTAELATMTAVAESNKRYVQSMHQDLQQAQQQLMGIAAVRVWKNEDGLEFLYAADVRAAINGETTTSAAPSGA
jgi:hypothetical protein